MEKSIQLKINTLIIIQNNTQDFLLLKRNKAPNRGRWSPIGGKIDTTIGESPHQCAIRETLEETGYKININDLHLFCMATEKNHQKTGHWLLFIFHYLKPISALPQNCPEGFFHFFSRKEIDTLALPNADHQILWPIFDIHHKDFIALRTNYQSKQLINTIFEQKK